MDSTTRTRPRWHWFATRFSTLLIAAALVGTASCAPSGGDPTGPNDDGEELGRYVLTKVDLGPPPEVIHNGPWFDNETGTFYNLFHVEVVDGEVRLLDGERFTFSISIGIDGDGQLGFTMVTVNGYYEYFDDDNEIHLIADDGTGELIGEISQGEIELEMDLMGKGVTNRLIFRK